jgi:hypothetical protein
MAATADLFGRKPIKVPGGRRQRDTLVVSGNLASDPAMDGEDCPERELDDPERCIRTLKDRRSHPVRADVLTFAQLVPATEPDRYPMQHDSIATIR